MILLLLLFSLLFILFVLFPLSAFFQTPSTLPPLLSCNLLLVLIPSTPPLPFTSFTTELTPPPLPPPPDHLFLFSSCYSFLPVLYSLSFLLFHLVFFSCCCSLHCPSSLYLPLLYNLFSLDFLFPPFHPFICYFVYFYTIFLNFLLLLFLLHFLSICLYFLAHTSPTFSLLYA